GSVISSMLSAGRPSARTGSGSRWSSPGAVSSSVRRCMMAPHVERCGPGRGTCIPRPGPWSGGSAAASSCPTRAGGADVSVALERVLDLLPGLLEVRGDLVLLALGLESLVTGRAAGGGLDVALDALGGVLHLVVGTHGSSFNDG